MRPISDSRKGEMMISGINVALSQYAIMYLVDAKRWAAQLKESAERARAEADEAGKCAADAATRIETFQPEKEGRKQCPACWMGHGRHSDLLVIEGTEDKYHCEKCRENFSSEIKP